MHWLQPYNNLTAVNKMNISDNLNEKDTGVNGDARNVYSNLSSLYLYVQQNKVYVLTVELRIAILKSICTAGISESRLLQSATMQQSWDFVVWQGLRMGMCK